MANVWVVRAGERAVYIDEFLKEGIVAIGWDLGPSIIGATKTELERQYRTVEPNATGGKVHNVVGQIDTFLHKMAPADLVLTHDRERRQYIIGKIDGAVGYRGDLPSDLRVARPVKWSRKAHRDNLSPEAKNTLGAIQTVFQIKGAVADEVLAKAVSLDDQEAPLSALIESSARSLEALRTAEQQWPSELLDKAEQAIEDRIVSLSWQEMQELVAGVLRAMGYKTKISHSGPDRGIDIFASPDGLGLQEPRIFVEVKHRPRQTMGSQEIRSFLGGRSEDDRCLYVSTGGFSKDAQYEADRSKIAVRLLTLVDLRELLVER